MKTLNRVKNKVVSIILTGVVQAQLLSFFAGKVIAAGSTSPYGPDPEDAGITGLELLPALGIVVWVVGTLILGNRSVLLKRIQESENSTV